MVILLLILVPVQAQFQLSGRIEGLKDSVIRIQVPFVYDFFAQSGLEVPVGKDGRFNFRFPLDKEKLVRVMYDKASVLVLARPGQSLVVGRANTGAGLKPTGGSLFKENKVLFEADPLEYPVFLEIDPIRDSLAKFEPDIIYARYIQPWIKHAQEKATAIEKTTISGRLKKLFIQEVRSAAYCKASEFAMQGFMKRDQLAAFYKRLYGSVSPKSTVSNPGPMYYWFVDYYNGYLESDAMNDLKASGNKKTEPLKYYTVSLDSGTALIKQKGKPYINWLAVKNTNSPDIAEAYLAQQVFTKYAEKDLKYASVLLKELKNTYPDSRYHPPLKKNVGELEVLLARNEHNKSIRIVDHYETITSVFPVIDSLKGKVVYLDIWGTWCGPCKQELKFTPQLKQYFKGKEVAFVYLDMDDDEKDAAWKEFIKVNELTGIHLRKTREQMAPFWKELLENAADKSEYYPQYFIFDKKGKLVVTKAERPSRKEVLYRQIESFLNQ